MGSQSGVTPSSGEWAELAKHGGWGKAEILRLVGTLQLSQRSGLWPLPRNRATS